MKKSEEKRKSVNIVVTNPGYNPDRIMKVRDLVNIALKEANDCNSVELLLGLSQTIFELELKRFVRNDQERAVVDFMERYKSRLRTARKINESESTEEQDETFR